ncbi:hypothetical protein CTI12_AA274460 [Artemisia annua]|uniref:Uncharacterized protein n=1 Tax=Artemisia annua TaxID=35608 RepID=A0A2U1NF01_ARTAN|nr:hypothetical protein CTI12_AA274460 [Artemisia annua]
MDIPDHDTNIFGAPPFLSLTPFPYPSSRRLSSNFTPPTRPVPAVRRQLAWVSLQGRIVGAEDATSAKRIGGGLGSKEAVAWDMFSPMHRVLVVAVIAVASTNAKKNRVISQLKKSVEIRDQVLSEMQEKLDSLCEQVNYFKDKPDISSYNFELSGCGCRHCDHHQPLLKYNEEDLGAKEVGDDEMIKFEMVNDVEQEERRMSNLSDWAPSVSSSTDVQWSTPVDQDIGKLQKECAEKDATIKELSDFFNSAESHNSKRISELEDIIRRKNMLITKLRKDMMVLEQKVIHLTRLRRPSSSKSSSSSKKLPVMSDNLIYDMDSTTSPSDDSDSSTKKKHRAPTLNNINKEELHAPSLSRQKPTAKSSEQPLQSISPLKERSLNQQANLAVFPKSKSKESRSVSGGGKIRNGTSSNSTKSRVSGQLKRWA